MADILLALDCGDIAFLTVLDLSAVFDTADHATLLTRMEILTSRAVPPAFLRSHFYADDTQIYGFSSPSAASELQSRVSACVVEDAVQ